MEKVTLQLESYRNKKSMIYEFAFDELDLVQDEANNRKILKILVLACLQQSSGTVDNANYENVDFMSLENSILEATKVGCKANQQFSYWKIVKRFVSKENAEIEEVG